MLPRFADIFQQGNRWLNWLEKQPEGSVRQVVIESVTKIMACGTTLITHGVVTSSGAHSPVDHSRRSDAGSHLEKPSFLRQ